MATVVDDLARMVAVPSVSNRPLTELAAFVAQRSEDVGFEVERFPMPGEPGRDNLLASIGPRGSDGLVLSGHMDVVPTEGQPWTSDPFTLTERGGKLYGRGSADMKGFIAATLSALQRIDSKEYTRELILAWTCDEEIGCQGSRCMATEMEASQRTLPKACVIGEPTGFRILRMHPGHVSMTLEFHGKAAHSSRPDLGSNAIEAASDAVREIQALAAELEHERAFEDLLERPWVAVNVGTISGGSAVNIVPDFCTMQVGYRPVPGMDPEEVHDRIVARLSKAGLTDFRSRIDRITPALLTHEGTPIQSTLAEHARIPGSGAASFATDGGNLSRVGAQPLIFGPGSIEVAHQADEFVERADVEHAVDVIESIIRARCCG